VTAAAIDWGQLFELVWVSAVAGFAVSLTFSLIILGIAKAEELRQADRTVVATAYAAMAAVGFALFAGGVIFGISVIVSK
jgi:Na+/H+-dicarboxylate symporter